MNLLTLYSEPVTLAFGLESVYSAFGLLYPRTPLIQAHNGYLEVYLNLGVVGLALLGGVLWTGLRNARRRLRAAHYTSGNLDDSLFQTFGMAYIACVSSL